MEKNNNALFYTCSLIEYIARTTFNHRHDILNYLGDDLKNIYNYADVFHCEPIMKVADDFITKDQIKNGNYDVISRCKYLIPDYWDIGEVFERLIEDVTENEADVFEGINNVYNSWLTPEILNFNTDLYYQPRDYIAECYKAGRILE